MSLLHFCELLQSYLCELHYNLICVSYITIIILLDLQNTSQIMPPTSVLYQENHVFDSAFIQKCTASLKSSSYPNLHPMSVLLEFQHMITPGSQVRDVWEVMRIWNLNFWMVSRVAAAVWWRRTLDNPLWSIKIVGSSSKHVLHQVLHNISLFF